MEKEDETTDASGHVNIGCDDRIDGETTILVPLSLSFHSVPEIGKTKEKVINKDVYCRNDNFLLLF
jgi:hypothetical protein